jgi:hypothetical protein
MQLEASAVLEYIQLNALHGLIADLHCTHAWLEPIPAWNRLSDSHDSLRQPIHGFKRHLLAHSVNNPHGSLFLRRFTWRNSFEECFDSWECLRCLRRFPG